MFQFQFGAIKRILPVLFGCTFPCFNSNLVRLKVDDFEEAIKGLSKFQFQFGAIKSKMHPARQFHISRFNSNLVRLKAPLNWTSKIASCCFNSNLVRLKG